MVYKTGVDLDRARLRQLSSRLLGLHKILLDRERHAYEALHGAVSPADLLRLLLQDEEFAWLRPLSTMIARIDELVDAGEPMAMADARALSRETYRLLKSGDRGIFQDRYREALQASPDVVMAHAGVSAMLPLPEEPPRA
jgi:hypothetical protein